MKISNLIFLSISFILLLFSLTTFINFKQSEEVIANAEYLSLSSNIVRQSNHFQRNILYMERGLRGFIMTGEDYFIQAYDSAALENEAVIKDLAILVSGDSRQTQKLEEITVLYHQWTSEFTRPLRDASLMARPPAASGKPAADLYSIAPSLRNEEALNKRMQEKFRELLNLEYANRASRKSTLEVSELNTKLISFSLTALSIVVGILIAFLLARHIGRRILKMVKMANTIAEGNYQVKVDVTGGDELSELTRSLNHMAATLSENISLLKRKNQELDQFAHIVSHDLKAPLRGIDNVISWIEEDHGTDLPPKVDEYFQLIKGRIRRSENLIQGILTYARIGREVQEKEIINLNELIGEVLETLPEKEGLTVEVQPGLPVLYSEKLPLLQIFTNLINNAVKYHDKPRGKVKVYCQEEKNHYTFFVEDDGPGIAQSYHKKIFVIFQTLQERDSLESTGVGLAIVKKILDERREKIKVISEPDKGSVFLFTWSKF
jgi:signal transduction histidine kinase